MLACNPLQVAIEYGIIREKVRPYLKTRAKKMDICNEFGLYWHLASSARNLLLVQQAAKSVVIKGENGK